MAAEGPTARKEGMAVTLRDAAATERMRAEMSCSMAIFGVGEGVGEPLFGFHDGNFLKPPEAS